jgi:hypothetical protein
MKEQLKKFFSRIYSKLFVIICLIIVVIGAINASIVVSTIKIATDVRIAEMKLGLDKPIYLGSYSNEEIQEIFELIRIKQAPSFQLFIEKFGFGWWGIIALVGVFITNILILFVKSLKKYTPIIIRTGSIQVKSVKTNVQNMPVFQRYLLLIALAVLIILVLIFIRI